MVHIVYEDQRGVVVEQLPPLRPLELLSDVLLAASSSGSTELWHKVLDGVDHRVLVVPLSVRTSILSSVLATSPLLIAMLLIPLRRFNPSERFVKQQSVLYDLVEYALWVY